MMDNLAGERKQMIAHCLHCGNKGLHDIVCKHERAFGGPVWDETGHDVVDYAPDEIIVWYLLSCPVCTMVTLYKEHTDERHGEVDSCETLYPYSRISFSAVPNHIKSAFESALKVKQIDTAICMLSLRRTLEAICKDKGAKGKSLDEMVNELISINMMPMALVDACWIIRRLGNEAAHTTETRFFVYEVEQVIGFIETIIDYLYELPAKISFLKTEVENRKTTRPSND